MSKINKYMFANKTKKWVDALPRIVAAYNRTYHSRIKMTPDDANSWRNVNLVRRNAYKTTPYQDATKVIHYKYQVGDRVLLATRQSHYSKAYRGVFIPVIYIIINRYRRNGVPVYKLRDSKKIAIKGSFYEPELIPAPTQYDGK